LLAHDRERTADIGNCAEQGDGIEQAMPQDEGPRITKKGIAERINRLEHH